MENPFFCILFSFFKLSSASQEELKYFLYNSLVCVVVCVVVSGVLGHKGRHDEGQQLV